MGVRLPRNECKGELLVESPKPLGAFLGVPNTALPIEKSMVSLTDESSVALPDTSLLSFIPSEELVPRFNDGLNENVGIFGSV